MTHLRILIGACFLLAVMGLVVAVPLGWTIVIGISEAYPEKLAAASLRSGRSRLAVVSERIRTENIDRARTGMSIGD
jgi:uncharacterized oligopeptide transporter (OPT) family protein